MAYTEDPPDGGWGWVCVMGKLFGYIFVLGSPSAFGIIYIDLIESFSTTREETAWIGSLAFGLTLITGPLASLLTSKFGIQKTIVAGTLLAFAGCFISWFANGFPYLYVSYGVIMGIGLGLILVPSVLIVVQYFKKRLGLASALGSAGSGLGTLVLPPIYTYLLEEYGWRGTLLILSAIILNGLVCAVIFIPPPHLKASPEGKSSNKPKSTTRQNYSDFIHNPCLVLHWTGSAMIFVGYIVPFVHVPDMAVLKGMDKYNNLTYNNYRRNTPPLPSFQFWNGLERSSFPEFPAGMTLHASYLVSIMGVSSITGRIVFGWISDFPCVNVIFLQGFSLIVCGVVTSVCPHLTHFAAFAAFSLLFGAFMGVYSSLIPVVIAVLVGKERTGDFLGSVLFLMGIMNTVASPLAGWLFDITKTYNASFYVAGCAFISAGLLDMAVMFLHKRQFSRDGYKMSSNSITVTQECIAHRSDTTTNQYEMQEFRMGESVPNP